MALITYQELAARLSVPVNTLYSWVANGKIPHVRLTSRVVRFDDEQITLWLASCTRT